MTGTESLTLAKIVSLGEVLRKKWTFSMEFCIRGGGESRVTLRFFRAEYGSQQSDQPENVNFEPIIRGLKSDIFEV